MGPISKFLNQTRKPLGLSGKVLLLTMNPGHAKLSDWGISHLNMVNPSEIVDIGCGGGRAVGELLKKYPNAKVTGIDYSPQSVEKTTQYNRNAVSEGRCIVKQGDVSSLTLDENRYDLATAFETIYFWPGLNHCFGQVVRILKPGGHFMIVNESDGLDAASQKFESIIDGMKIYTAQQIEAALYSAGFSNIRTDHHVKNPWITIIARK